MGLHPEEWKEGPTWARWGGFCPSGEKTQVTGKGQVGVQNAHWGTQAPLDCSRVCKSTGNARDPRR